MKKTLLLTLSLVLFAAVSTYGQMRAGLGVGYGLEVEQPAINANFEYMVTDVIGAAGSFSYFTTDSQGGIDSKFSAVNLDGHYYFMDSDIKAYGILGVNIGFAKVEGEILGFKFDESNTEIGANLGAGALYDLGGSIFPYAELKYAGLGGDADQIVIFVGAKFEF